MGWWWWRWWYASSDQYSATLFIQSRTFCDHKNRVNLVFVIRGSRWRWGWFLLLMVFFNGIISNGAGTKVSSITSVLSACSQLGLLDAEYEDLANARLIFEGMAHGNRTCWNSMISGFGYPRTKENKRGSWFDQGNVNETSRYSLGCPSRSLPGSFGYGDGWQGGGRVFQGEF